MRLVVLLSTLALFQTAQAEPHEAVEAGIMHCDPSGGSAFAPVSRHSEGGLLALVAFGWTVPGRGACLFAVEVSADGVPLPRRPFDAASGGVTIADAAPCSTAPPQAGCQAVARLRWWIDPATTLGLRVPFRLLVDGTVVAHGNVTALAD